MHSADDSSTLLPATSEIQRDAADKAESAARAAATRVTAWLQRSPTGPLTRARCADNTAKTSAAIQDPPEGDSRSPNPANRSQSDAHEQGETSEPDSVDSVDSADSADSADAADSADSADSPDRAAADDDPLSR